jgi:hypothetical protein
MGKDETEDFEVTLKSGEKEYFMRGSPKGLVIGPKTVGTDDHLTIGMNGDDFNQIHRKINGREDWRVTPEALEAEIDSFITNNTEIIDSSGLSAPGTYVVSLRRAQVLFSTVSGLASVPLRLFFPLFVAKEVTKTENGTEVRATIEIGRITHILSRAEPKIARFFQVFGPSLFRVWVSIAKRTGRWMLIKSGPNMLNGEGIAFVLSESRIGLIWENDGRMKYLSAESLMQVYERIERNQPFGKLLEIGNLKSYSTVISVKSWQ